MNNFVRVRNLVSNIHLECLGTQFKIHIHYDKIHNKVDGLEPRVYIQLKYIATDRKTGIQKQYSGAKWYLSSKMIDDEIVKKVYLAFRTCVEHEVLEGFFVEGVPIFNPHIDYKQLIKIGNMEVQRENVSLQKI